MCTHSFLWLIVSTIFVDLHGATMDIECGQSMVDIVDADETVSFQFVIDEEQNVIFIDTNNTFLSTVVISDDAGNSENVSAKESWFDPHPLSAGTHSVEMTPDGEGGMFKIEMICFIEDLSEFDGARFLQHSTFYLFSTRSGFMTTFESFDDDTDSDTDSYWESGDGSISGEVVVETFGDIIEWILLRVVVVLAIIGIAIALCVHFRNKRRINRFEDTNGANREKIVLQIPNTSTEVEGAGSTEQ